MSSIYRKYVSKDFPAIKQLFYESVHSTADDVYSVAQKEAWAPRDVSYEHMHTALQNTIAYCAFDNDLLVGFGNIDSAGYLDYLYVDKDFQRRGIGSALLKILEDEARTLKLSHITTHASLVAKPLFEKYGFKVVKEQQVLRNGVLLTNFEMIKYL